MHPDIFSHYSIYKLISFILVLISTMVRSVLMPIGIVNIRGLIFPNARDGVGENHI